MKLWIASNRKLGQRFVSRKKSQSVRALLSEGAIQRAEIFLPLVCIRHSEKSAGAVGGFFYFQPAELTVSRQKAEGLFHPNGNGESGETKPLAACATVRDNVNRHRTKARPSAPPQNGFIREGSRISGELR